MQEFASTKQRRSRFSKPDHGHDIRGDQRAIDTLRLFDSYRLLPFNWIHELVRDSGDYVGHRNLCTRMVVHAGLLDRFTFNGTKNTSETMTYWRTERGDKYLHQKGHEGLPHDGTHDAHQVLTDLIDAQMQLGSRKGGAIFMNWQRIQKELAFPQQPDHPFRFPIGKNPLNGKVMNLVPDGRPCLLKHGDRSALFLKELDRNNENPQIIKNKIRNYLTCIEDIKTRYGRKQVMVLFVTTDPTRLINLMRWTEEVNNGPSKLFLFGFIDDHVKHTRSTASVVTDLFDKPLMRAGRSPFLMKTLTEM